MHYVILITKFLYIGLEGHKFYKFGQKIIMQFYKYNAKNGDHGAVIIENTQNYFKSSKQCKIPLFILMKGRLSCY